MWKMSARFSLPLLAAAAVMLSGNAAHAGSYPASLVGAWKGTSNLTSMWFNVSSQGSTGVCKAITGLMGDGTAAANSTLQGYCCPTTGQLTFLRKNKTNGQTFQVYTVAMAQAASGYVPRMDGMFSEAGNPNALGMYGFEAYLAPLNPP